MICIAPCILCACDDDACRWGATGPGWCNASRRMFQQRTLPPKHPPPHRNLLPSRPTSTSRLSVSWRDKSQEVSAALQNIGRRAQPGLSCCIAIVDRDQRFGQTTATGQQFDGKMFIYVVPSLPRMPPELRCASQTGLAYSLGHSPSPHSRTSACSRTYVRSPSL